PPIRSLRLCSCISCCASPPLLTAPLSVALRVFIQLNSGTASTHNLPCLQPGLWFEHSGFISKSRCVADHLHSAVPVQQLLDAVISNQFPILPRLGSEHDLSSYQLHLGLAQKEACL
ncbi:UNVERIFIED_CONTAM: hypothetical protein K2H54_019661, partial [Gekko kuhli]